MRKNLRRCLIVTLVAVTLLSLSPRTSLAETYTGTLNKDKVFFRARPNTDSIFYDQLDKGTKVTLLGISGNFYKVEYKKQSGYIMRSLVNAPSAALRAFGVQDKEESASKYSKINTISGLGEPPRATRKGSSGDHVEKLQRALQIKGYLKGRVDGIYGNMTVDAVKAYQKAVKLEMTGDANSQTILKLFGRAESIASKDDPGMKGITSIGKIEVPNTTKPGNSGRHVKALQQALKLKGYYKASIDSSYGDLTTEAVKKFQRAYGLKADGIAGNSTIKKLFGKNAANYTIPVNKLDWFKGGSGTIPQWSSFTVKDVSSGLTFSARRWSGYNHLDAEPLTKKDAAVLKKIAGGAYSWARRAILVKYDGKVYAASMNTMPHEEESIRDNNYEGHFCIHFTNSKTHGTNKLDSAHQNAVKRALGSEW
ncbi:MAG: SH3 domain-containing protein [Clostridiales bacterium]|jgi:peptidoglycan hydrolase-like protein with peptidoglycan-binding domain|nr:SH3 domain-containing protein [Clostridiales bacterium]